jgi:hypothetical protein
MLETISPQYGPHSPIQEPHHFPIHIVKQGSKPLQHTHYELNMSFL